MEAVSALVTIGVATRLYQSTAVDDTPLWKVGLTAAAAWWLLTQLYTSATVYALIYFLPAWYCADLIVGCVHLTGDFFQLPQFIGHHTNPIYMASKSYVHHTFRSYTFSAVLLGAVQLLWGFRLPDYLLLTWLCTIQGNEVHAWLHTSHDPPTWFKWLQQHGWLITRETHFHHHRDEYDRNFCTLNGWANSSLNCISIPLYSRGKTFRSFLLASPTYMALVKRMAA